MKKAGSGIGKGLLKALARSMYPHLTEDSEIFFEVGSDGALSEKYRRTTSHHLNDRRGVQTREELGCRKRL